MSNAIRSSETEVLQLAARAASVDALVRETAEAAAPPATLVAVGGYGRRELFPCSDVDLLLLVDAPPESGPERDAISDFLRRLWDAGLRVSQSVRTVAECCEIHQGNLELTISLLDRRFLAGGAARYHALAERFPHFLTGERTGIIRHLCRMTRARHVRYGSTIFHLEPDVKEHPGGLRDMHVLHWLALLNAGVVPAPEEARDFLFSVRVFLHQRAGRDSNILDFDAQEARSADPSAWMRDYYRNSRAVFRAIDRTLHQVERNEMGILAQFRDWRNRLSNSEFTVSQERVLLREPGLFERDPSALYRLLEFLARHGLRLAPDTEQRLAAALPALDSAAVSSWSGLRDLVKLAGCAVAFRALHEAGLLASLIPEWSRIDALVMRDFNHLYTVDEHTLVALESLTSLSTLEDQTRRRLRNLLAETADLELLRLALLLHDIGKGAGTGEHAPDSVKIAKRVLNRFGAPANARDTIVFLISHHLDLSWAMSARDPDDPATAASLAEQIGSIERLKLLTLMTYADIAAVNPHAMTSWRMEQLWRLYLATQAELTRGLDTDRIHGLPSDPETARFLEGFPTRYLRTHSQTEIAAHVALARELEPAGAAVSVSRQNDFFRADVVTRDRPSLLASLAGALAGFGLSIVKAEAFSNGSGVCLDSFVFSDPHRSLDQNPSEAERLRHMLSAAAIGSADIRKLLKNRPKPPRRPGPPVNPAITFNNQASAHATLIEIVAADRPGLLYDLAQVIAAGGLNIEVILIDTEAGKALDVFYVTRERGKLTEDAQMPLRDALAAACA